MSSSSQPSDASQQSSVPSSGSDGFSITITTGEIVGLAVGVTFAIIGVIIAIVVLCYYCSCCGKRKNRLSTIRYDDNQETAMYPAWNSQSWADWNALPQTYKPTGAQKVLEKFGQSRS
ncbi:hypothetical protein CLAFUW4_09014 [Fulvia fulva]|uniref:Uncharacterized protein n=1 Tax=Passalora fulva TaxID=5499 RepID=A0A9Q8UT46_PASFU|nr:uncharacterized protein CLAFUR5_09123 [Fulvia fulva]KAK4614167.1 hypothetical protein CLAFUR4_09020 [Fulvia fulva]KAK4614508.1 hypothetical protein CLAFUR0_09012 [Fulvia fulva]UJO21519.1 hypothetical protein CLAFUR5_09123 [Fulvia fulva]WPV20656.1 hypothetical protein CLAFUW4_09014 [Fulvia fulva]WPV34960.1 hypothetical protein CLAFUW7_09015 [Fulvia fulva]